MDIRREKLLSDKREEILSSLTLWAKSNDILIPGEQLVFEMNIKRYRLVTGTCNRLTTREKQIMVMLASGMTAKEVANNLGLSIKTIEAHKHNIMGKIGVHNQSELTRYTIDNGFMEPESSEAVA